MEILLYVGTRLLKYLTKDLFSNLKLFLEYREKKVRLQTPTALNCRGNNRASFVLEGFSLDPLRHLQIYSIHVLRKVLTSSRYILKGCVDSILYLLPFTSFKMKGYTHLPGQLSVLQSSDSCRSPGQSAPPCTGNGLSQKRCLFLLPPLQPLLQTVHEDHFPHDPPQGNNAESD